MSINSHRILKVIYAEKGLSFRSGSPLGNAIENHAETNDFRNMDGNGVVELPLRALQEILEDQRAYLLEVSEIKALKEEIDALRSMGTDESTYIQYDMF